MIIKNTILLLISFALISCGSNQESQVQESDSTDTVQEEACTCEKLQQEIAEIRAELKTLKKQKKSGSVSTGSNTQNTNTQKAGSSTSKPQFKRDSDGSMRCIKITAGVKCTRRTFSRNGLCWKHGGDEAVSK